MSIFYMDYDLGVDSGGIATDTPLGWWSGVFTAGQGAAPTADIVCTNNGQTAKLTVVGALTGGSWAGNDAAGTLYFYGKTGAFASGTITWGSGGTAGQCTIAADLNYNPWKTITSGATAARIAPGDTIRIKQSPPPTSLGVTGKWTGNTKVGGGFPTALTITGAASNGVPNLIRLEMADTSTLTTDDVVQCLGVLGTVEANGSWLCTVIDATHIDLQGSVFTNAFSAGGTQTCQQINSKAVVLASALTLNITNCGTNTAGTTLWTGANDGTPSVISYTSTAKEGTCCTKILLDSAPQANKIQAYMPVAIPAATAGNYNCISFWIVNQVAIADATTWTITLCSNADGTGVLDTFVIPAIPYNTIGTWIPLTIARTGGGTLGNNGATAIASIAVNSGATAPTASKYIYLDNIIATATGSLNLQSLISLNSDLKGGTEGWYGIQSISPLGTIVLLDNETNMKSNEGRGYSGTGGTATTYIRETTKTALAATIITAVQACQESGTAGNLISYEGGYDTATNTQIGETFYDGLKCFGYGLQWSSKNYTSINYLNFIRYNYGIYYLTSTYNTITTLTNVNNNYTYGVWYDTTSNNNTIITLTNANNNGHAGVYFLSSTYNTITTLTNVNNNTTYGVYYDYSSNNTITTLTNANNNGSGVVHTTISCNNTITTLTNANNNNASGVVYTGNTCNNAITTLTNANANGYGGVIYTSNSGDNTITTLTNANNNDDYGVYCSYSNNNTIFTMSATGNGVAAVFNNTGTNYIRNATLVGTEFAGVVSYVNSRIYSNQHDGSAGNHYIYTDNGVIQSQDGPTYGHTTTAGTICWKLSPTNVIRNSNYPLDLTIAKIACVANKEVTVKAWMKLTSTTDILGALVCRQGQLAGLTTIAKTNTGTADTSYHEVTLTFEPTEAGVVEIQAWAWWVSGDADESVYIDDMTISQAT